MISAWWLLLIVPVSSFILTAISFTVMLWFMIRKMQDNF